VPKSTYQKLTRLRKAPDSTWPFAISLIAAVLWIYLVRKNLGDGDWYSDDAYFRLTPVFSVRDIFAWLLTPVDDDGYYRPVQRVLFMFASLLPVQSFSNYQWLTIGIILIAAGIVGVIAIQWIGSSWAGAISTIAFLFSAPHIKPLAWSNQWYQGSSVLFCAAALYCRVAGFMQKEKKYRILSIVFWFFAAASNNGVHSFFLILLYRELR
jgi:hypothetical protein